MSLLQRILHEKRRLIVPLAVALVANLGAYLFIVRPLAASSAGAADRAAAARSTRRAAERELGAARALVSGKSRADDELDSFYHDALPADLAAARRMTYARLPALARQTSVRFEQRSFSVDSVEDAPQLGKLSIKMDLQGSYENIRQFIYQLEQAPEFVIIDDVQLAEAATQEPVSLAITLSTYFRVSADGF